MAKRIDFSEEDEQAIASTARWGRTVAWLNMALGILGAGISLILAYETGGSVLDDMISILLLLVLGGQLIHAADAFQKVAETDEADVDYLLEGLRNLRDYFRLAVFMVGFGTVSILVVKLLG